jgi:hypothetical protein
MSTKKGRQVSMIAFMLGIAAILFIVAWFAWIIWFASRPDSPYRDGRITWTATPYSRVTPHGYTRKQKRQPR